MTENNHWPSERRLDYIDWRLSHHGEIQRADLMRVFGVSEGQASGDLNAFLAAYEAAMTYDKSAKRYVPARNSYRRQRKGPWVEAIDWARVDG